MNDHSTDGGDTTGRPVDPATDARGMDAAPLEATSGDGRKLDAMSRSSIESRLKSMYDEVASEPVPDRFLQLLDKLERSEGDVR